MHTRGFMVIFLVKILFPTQAIQQVSVQVGTRYVGNFRYLCRSKGRAVQELRAMEAGKNKKIVTKMLC